MKKNTLFNIIMVAVIILFAAGALLFVGGTKGLFGVGDDIVYINEMSGTPSLTRNGVAFTPEAGTSLREGDILSCSDIGRIVIMAREDMFVMDSTCEIFVESCDDDGFEFVVNHGEMFGVINSGEISVSFTAGSDTITADSSVFAVSVQDGSYTLNVLEGKIILRDSDVVAGNTVSASDTFYKAVPFEADLLSDFVIKESVAQDGKVLCFSDGELSAVLTDREKAKLPVSAGSDADIYLAQEGSESVLCTVNIVCDVILGNIESLEPGKDAYVPSDGVILATKTCEVSKGMTAFELLREVCEIYEIPLEYSWTPGYNSYYVEGINHLYEFDCGPTSGWNYNVNGWRPNYGSSQYEIEDGDSILWTYVCEY